MRLLAILFELEVNVIFAGYPEWRWPRQGRQRVSIPTVAVDLESDPLAMRYIESLALPGWQFDQGCFLIFGESAAVKFRGRQVS